MAHTYPVTVSRLHKRSSEELWALTPGFQVLFHSERFLGFFFCLQKYEYCYLFILNLEALKCSRTNDGWTMNYKTFFFFLKMLFHCGPFWASHLLLWAVWADSPLADFTGGEPAVLASAWGTFSAGCLSTGTHFPESQQKWSEEQLSIGANVQTPASFFFFFFFLFQNDSR